MLEHVFKQVGALAAAKKTNVSVVGGFVRDSLLKKTHTKDADFVVDGAVYAQMGAGLAFAQAFAQKMGQAAGTLIEFPEFDTARFVFVEEREEKNAETGEVHTHRTPLFEIEFAGARAESYRKESRKPAVTPATLTQDLSRRDFTVNAMARRVEKDGSFGPLVDPFGGQDDLKKKILKTPLAPDETFSDDPLRMLRAARFAAQLQFAIEPNTYDAIARNAKRIKIVSQERILEEFMKLLAAPKPSAGLWILHNTGLMRLILPEVSNLEGVEDVYGKTHKDNLSHSFQVVDNIAEQSDKILLRFAGLLHDIGKPGTKHFDTTRGWTFDMHEHLGKKMVRAIGRRLRMSKDHTEYIARLVRWHMQPINLMDEGVSDSAVRRLIVNLQDELPELLVLCRSDITTGNPKKKAHRLKNYDRLERVIEEVKEKDRLRAFQSPVRGEEIMEACGLKPGPTVGKIKEAIEEAILDGKIPNDYEPARAYFEEIKDAYMKDAALWEKV